VKEFFENPLPDAHLESVFLDELSKLWKFKPEGATHLNEWNSALVHPAVQGRCRYCQEFGCVIYRYECTFGLWLLHCISAFLSLKRVTVAGSFFPHNRSNTLI
jgi:hypothetical protein